MPIIFYKIANLASGVGFLLIYNFNARNAQPDCAYRLPVRIFIDKLLFFRKNYKLNVQTKRRISYRAGSYEYKDRYSAP